jgi:hypothetical protein
MLGKENRIGWPLHGWTKKPQGLTGPQIGSLLQQEREGKEMKQQQLGSKTRCWLFGADEYGVKGWGAFQA